MTAIDTDNFAAASLNDQIWSGGPAVPPQGLTVTDYARKIHWWVRLFGVVWLASIAFAVAVGLFFGIAIAIQSSDETGSYTPSFSSPGSVSVSGMSYQECMTDPRTTYDQCLSLK